MVEGVVGVGFIKQVDETINDGVDIEDRSPILSQDIQTYFALQVDVWMVDLGIAFDLWR